MIKKVHLAIADDVRIQYWTKILTVIDDRIDWQQPNQNNNGTRLYNSIETLIHYEYFPGIFDYLISHRNVEVSNREEVIKLHKQLIDGEFISCDDDEKKAYDTFQAIYADQLKLPDILIVDFKFDGDQKKLKNLIPITADNSDRMASSLQGFLPILIATNRKRDSVRVIYTTVYDELLLYSPELFLLLSNMPQDDDGFLFEPFKSEAPDIDYRFILNESISLFQKKEIQKGSIKLTAMQQAVDEVLRKIVSQEHSIKLIPGEDLKKDILSISSAFDKTNTSWNNWNFRFFFPLHDSTFQLILDSSKDFVFVRKSNEKGKDYDVVKANTDGNYELKHLMWVLESLYYIDTMDLTSILTGFFRDCSGLQTLLHGESDNPQPYLDRAIENLNRVIKPIDLTNFSELKQSLIAYQKNNWSKIRNHLYYGNEAFKGFALDKDSKVSEWIQSLSSLAIRDIKNVTNKRVFTDKEIVTKTLQIILQNAQSLQKKIYIWDWNAGKKVILSIYTRTENPDIALFGRGNMDQLFKLSKKWFSIVIEGVKPNGTIAPRCITLDGIEDHVLDKDWPNLTLINLKGIFSNTVTGGVRISLVFTLRAGSKND